MFANFHFAKTYADGSIVTMSAGINVLTCRALWSNAAFLPLVAKIRPVMPIAVFLDCQLRKRMIDATVVNPANKH